MGFLTGNRSIAINSLGIAILFITLYNPLFIREIGFQFSFIVTAAILIWFSPCDRLLQKFFMKRPLSQIVDFDWIDQHAYCILCFLRQALALTIAVNLVALPLTLFYFQKFPFMSLIYNLFFPFTVSLSILLLLFACLTAPLFSWLSDYIHTINYYYTQFILNLTFNLPKAFDFNVYVTSISQEHILYYFVAIFALGIYMHTRQHDQETPAWMV